MISSSNQPAFLYLSITLLAAGCSSPETTEVTTRHLTDAVFANGHIIMEDEYLLTANTEGYLTRSLVKEGDSVAPGNELFFLSNDVQSSQLANAQANYIDALNKLNASSPQITQLQLQIEQARIQLEADQKNYERYQRLVKTNAVSQHDFEQVKVKYESSRRNVEILEKSLQDLINTLKLNLNNAETQLEIQKENNADYFLSSSIEGKVLDIYKNQGELVRRGETVAQIGGGKPLIRLLVAEEDIHRIRPGQKAVISLNTNPDDLFNAQVSKIYPSFDEKEQSFIIEAEFIRLPTPLFANTQLQANIIIDSRQNALVIPIEFLLPGDSVQLDKNTRKAVKTGIKNQQWVEIVSGLESGQEILLPSKKP